MAATPSEEVIVLESISNRGSVIKKEVVLIKGQDVLVNREKLGPTEIITQSDNLRKISTFLVSETGSPCLAGKFNHYYKNKKGKIFKEEHGCLSSERFKYLENSFKGLKKDSVTE